MNCDHKDEFEAECKQEITDIAMSVVSCIAEKLRAMEVFFFEVQPDDVEHEDLLNVMEMGHSSHQYLNMF